MHASQDLTRIAQSQPISSVSGELMDVGLGNLPDWDLVAINATLAAATPATILRWALAQHLPTIATTSFGEHAAATLSLLAECRADIPVVWVNTGLANANTLAFKDQLQERLKLDLHTFEPHSGAAASSTGEGAHLESHDAFVERVKLEPFSRAIQTLNPNIWISGIRGDETAFRSTLDIVTWDKRGILKVAPFFHWSEEQVEQYLAQRNLPINRGYEDPTKAAPHLECGLHR